MLAFIGANLMYRRAIKAVIRIFRENHALTAGTAKFAIELGFKRTLFQFKGLRDYKPAALQLLMRNNIIQSTDDGRLFLSEETLAQTNLGQQR